MSSQGTIFFMMLPKMFLLGTYFSILPPCFKARINCYEYYRRSRKSRSTAVRKIDFLNVVLHFLYFIRRDRQTVVGRFESTF